MRRSFESWLRCRVQVMDVGRAERRFFLSIFLEKCPLCPPEGMFCVRFWAFPGRFSMMSVGLGGGVRPRGWRWLIGEGHEVSRRKLRSRAQVGRLASGGSVAPAWRGTRREGQLRIELCCCRGVTGRERQCQDAGESAVTFLLGAVQFQNVRCWGLLESGCHCGDIIAHLCQFVKGDAEYAQGKRILIGTPQ